MKCISECRKHKTPCKNKHCRLWVNYKQDLNCVSEVVAKNGSLTLREVAKRMGVSFVRIKQIEDAALKKLNNLRLKSDF